MSAISDRPDISPVSLQNRRATCYKHMTAKQNFIEILPMPGGTKTQIVKGANCDAKLQWIAR
jgi:hypothetical protein